MFPFCFVYKWWWEKTNSNVYLATHHVYELKTCLRLVSRTTNVHKYFGNHKISLYRHEIRYYLFKCFIILLVFLSTFFLSAADSFKINLKYFYISINCLRTVIWIMHRLLFKLKNIYLNNAFFLSYLWWAEVAQNIAKTNFLPCGMSPKLWSVPSADSTIQMSHLLLTPIPFCSYLLC